MHSPTLFVTVFATLLCFVAATGTDLDTRAVHHHHNSAKARAHAHKNHKHHTANRSAKNRKTHKATKKTTTKKTTKAVVGKSAAVVSTGSLNSKLASVTSACGGADPVAKTTLTSGPNGNEHFLTCGITTSGWNPPMVTMDMIKTVDLADAKSLFGACVKYQSLFEKYGKQFGIAPILLASFAMQESSCNPNTSGDSGGAFGLMQITKDKCGGAPNGDCSDPDFNVKMGAKTFADGLEAANGNVLVALGAYNGWFVGMTKAQATAAANSDCCNCQQNLDYLHQVLNGWCNNVDPYSMKMGSFDNLAVCGSDSN